MFSRDGCSRYLRQSSIYFHESLTTQVTPLFLYVRNAIEIVKHALSIQTSKGVILTICSLVFIVDCNRQIME